MKTIKRIFLGFLAIIILLAIYLGTLDGDYKVERSRLIKANPQVVFNDLIDYKNWKDWGPWYEQDSTLQAQYPEVTAGEGGSYSWTSELDGDGYMVTRKLVEFKSIEQEIFFKTPFGEMKSNVYWRIKEVNEGSELTWGMSGKMGFFFRYMTKSMVKDMGEMQERGLELFDENIMKKMKVYSVDSIGLVDYSGGFYLYSTTSTKISEINSKFPQMMSNINDFILNEKIRTQGSPFTIYHKFDQENGTSMFSVCYPIPERILTPKSSDILTGFNPRGTYFKTILTGSYDNSEMAWQEAYEGAGKLEDYQIDQEGEPFEVYVNNFLTTPNPANLITEIYIPVSRVFTSD